jgi:hypothetical protein
MRIMSEMLAIVGTPDPLKDQSLDYLSLVKMKEEQVSVPFKRAFRQHRCFGPNKLVRLSMASFFLRD